SAQKRADTCPSRIRSPEQNDLHPALSAHRAVPAAHWNADQQGRALHALRGFLFLANEGKIRRRHYEEQLNQASCLNLVTNAVVLWNTVYMSAVLDQLKAKGYPVDDAECCASLASTLREHQSLREISLQRRRRIPPQGSPPTEGTPCRLGYRGSTAFNSRTEPHLNRRQPRFLLRPRN